MNYADMTVAQLEAQNEKLMAQRADLRAQQRELTSVLDQKRAAEALERDIAALKAKHGVQNIQVQGIPSAEAVGND